jgi:biotin carboxyl carrier protein
MQGTIVSVAVVEGATVRRGEVVLVMNSMKMEHVVHAAYSGRVWKVAVAPEDTVSGLQV